jgi:hypothetical protein
MSESDDRYQSTEDKEHASDDKDVEGHQAGQGVPRAVEADDGEPDVEGHAIAPQTITQQADG